MSLKRKNIADRIEELLGSGQNLTLEEVMMIHYGRPCRVVFPGSDDRIITEVHAQCGSVIIGPHEVVLVKDPTDEELIGPEEGEKLTIEWEKPTRQFQHNTTIIRRGLGPRLVTYYLDDCAIKMETLDLGKIWDRWATEILFMKKVRCFEETAVMGKRGGASLLRYSSPEQADII